MELNEPDYSLLARYLAEKCTVEERQIVERWIVEAPDNVRKLKEFKRIWELSGAERNSEREGRIPEQEWEQLKLQMNSEERKGARLTNISSTSLYEHKRFSIHSAFQKTIRVAAILLVAGFCGIFAYSHWSESTTESVSREPILKEINTSVAQRANLTLGDGTEVILNADSKMEFPENFAPDIREVYLQGEAHFNVKSNPDRPFVIHSAGTVTRVLGTSFAIRSYPEEAQVQVVVEEGRVSFRSTEKPSSSASILNENELGRYLLSDGRVVTDSVDDMELYLGWKKGILKFKEAPLSKVAREIERRYGVQVTFEEEETAAMSLTAFLKSRSIRNVLDVIATSLNINYRFENNDVTFYQE
ncbi:FecR family protein [Fodinibius salsisoli]|uniref:FecR domain-containing protein n=1 Tax=Fodinibius salsisoli TaxID=2820877 RepID=A0ABT3PRQ7_9BACT|nr:FecR domain-containing protein [Fodinibius salsisoli]MCW9708550.1 FecR domain-containing protein [Fodinibius salsisoli]